MRLIVSVLWVAALAVVAPACTIEHATTLGMIDDESGKHVYQATWALELPFPDATIVVVHPWTSVVATTYLITLDDAPLAFLGVGQHVVWRTMPRDLILGMKSRDGLHLTQVLRAEPAGTYYFRTSRRGLERTTQAEGQALVELTGPAEVSPD